MKKIKNLIEGLNLNYKKEIGILLAIDIFLILGLVGILFLNISFIFIAIYALMIPIFNYYYLNRYQVLKHKKELKLDNEFIELFSYIRIYLFNQETVYTSLKNILEFSSPKMKERIEGLLGSIDEDKTIQPFIDFARLFQNKLIEEVMISLYEMVNTGNSELYLNQFIKVFEDFKNRYEKDKETKRYDKFDRYNMLSLVGSGMIMIILSLAVISLVGEVSNGF